MAWAATHDCMVQQVSLNADAYAQVFLSDRGIETYWDKMLIGYAKLQRFSTIIDNADIPLPNPEASAEKML